MNRCQICGKPICKGSICEDCRKRIIDDYNYYIKEE